MFEQLNNIREAYIAAEETVDESDLLAIVLTTAPAKYQGVLAAVHLQKKDALTLDDFEEAMDQVYRQANAVKNKIESASHEIVLAMVDHSSFNL